MANQFQVKALTDNIVEVTMGHHVFLDINVTDKVDAALNAIDPNRKFYQIVIANGPYAVDPEMRHAMEKRESGIKQLAIAWISPDEKANQEQEAIVSKLSLPAPIRFFSDRQKGLDWLQSLAEAAE